MPIEYTFKCHFCTTGKFALKFYLLLFCLPSSHENNNKWEDDEQNQGKLNFIAY